MRQLLRKTVCGALIAILPASLVAQGADSAMLHANGAVYLNGQPSPASTAIFLHDVIQTRSGSDDAAKIEGTGMRVVLQSETMVQFEGNEFILDHGKLLVDTSTGLKVHVGCMVIIPVNSEWTDYGVSDLDGTVTVEAHRNDVRIETLGNAGKQPETFRFVIVHEGKQATREEKCGVTNKTPADAYGAVLSSPEAKIIGTGVIGGVLIWLLLGGSSPASPAIP